MNLVLTILKTVPLFQTLTEEEHESIIAHITMQYFPAGHTLFEKGSLGDAMYIIKSGHVRISSTQGELATLKEGDFFGEMALISNEPRNATAQTLSETEIFVLNKEDFISLMEKSPQIAEKVQEAYAMRTATHQT